MTRFWQRRIAVVLIIGGAIAAGLFGFLKGVVIFFFL
jgi:hypothetical protein